MTRTKHIRHSETQLRGSSFKRFVSLAACIKPVDFFIWKIYLSDNIYQNCPRLHLLSWFLWWHEPNHCHIPAVSVCRTRAQTSRKPRKVTSCLEKLFFTQQTLHVTASTSDHIFTRQQTFCSAARGSGETCSCVHFSLHQLPWLAIIFFGTQMGLNAYKSFNIHPKIICQKIVLLFNFYVNVFSCDKNLRGREMR